jgi:primosomal protein N' (replication factor Y)
VGSLVQVPFHGRLVRGWILGATDDVPPARTLPVRKVVARIRFFDADTLALLRWVSDRYVAPLAAVIARSHPPRVASEEDLHIPGRAKMAPSSSRDISRLAGYRQGPELAATLPAAKGAFVLRPAPEDETAIAVDAVERCLDGGRRAVVLVPEARPLPATAEAIVERFGPRVGLLVGGDRRSRYRTWLDVGSGRFDVVVGTRPAVFAPVDRLGLILVSRESHPAHREDRSPYYHVRDVALERARRAGAVAILSSLAPSTEAAALGLPTVEPAGRRWPPVEVVRPGPEGRAARLIRALREVRRGFILAPQPGYGLAQVCRSCGRPAACAVCGGLLRAEEGSVRCVVCEADGRCAACGANRFGIRRGGAERVQEWAAGTAAVPVRRLRPGSSRLPGRAEVLVGGPENVRDLGVGNLDLVAILDADAADRRPGLSARERALSTWMEAIAWARPAGRAIVQSERPGDPAIQALVRGNPDRFHADERRRRADAGFPVGAAVFRVAGAAELPVRLGELSPITMLVSAVGEQTVCLLALGRERVAAFGGAVRELAARDLVTRVEAEPHL